VHPLAAVTSVLYRPAGQGVHGHTLATARPVGLKVPRGQEVDTRMDSRSPGSKPDSSSGYAPKLLSEMSSSARAVDDGIRDTTRGL
jgi:hypothetical protein